MVDLESLESDAFHFLHSNPDYSRRVIGLVEEMRKAREFQAALEKIIDDDKLIINGLLEDYKLMERVAIAAKKFFDGRIGPEEFIEAWTEIEKRLAKLV